MDISHHQKLRKRKSQTGSEKPLVDKQDIKALRNIKPIKIPGTSKLMPPFDYDDPHVQMWLGERLNQCRKTNPKISYKEFLEKIASKMECYNRKDIHILNEDELIIHKGKIIAMPADLRDLPEFDWDDPEQKKWAEEQLEKWRKKEPNLTSEELDRRVDALLESEKELRKKSEY